MALTPVGQTVSVFFYKTMRFSAQTEKVAFEQHVQFKAFKCVILRPDCSEQKASVHYGDVAYVQSVSGAVLTVGHNKARRSSCPKIRDN